VDAPKIFFNSKERKILKRVGARTQPCFTPLFLMLNEPLYSIMTFSYYHGRT
jgi:hypothetical protein